MQISRDHVLAFDVYGTLVDPHGLGSLLATHAGEKAEAISVLWRQFQLEFSFRRALMKDYVPFATVTR